jgi:hypothetical protein
MRHWLETRWWKLGGRHPACSAVVALERCDVSAAGKVLAAVAMHDVVHIRSVAGNPVIVVDFDLRDQEMSNFFEPSGFLPLIKLSRQYSKSCVKWSA